MYSLAELAQKLALPILSANPLSGGDICEAYKLKIESGLSIFAKYHPDNYAKAMFQCEALGLKTIAESNTCPVPNVLYLDDNLLCLTYIDSAVASPASWKQFGRQLAKMHQVSNDHFGFKVDGYIGRIKQSNNFNSNGFDFICKQRFDPLVKILYDSGALSVTLLKAYEHIKSQIENIIPAEPASLIHGDLWSGNVIESKQDVYLIDCAPAYSHRGFDLGMMTLFGGFGNDCLESYKELYPVSKELRSCLDLFQLYYLLIHLLLFGSSYYNSVATVLNKYS